MKDNVYLRYVINLLPEEFVEKGSEFNQNLIFLVPVIVLFFMLF